MATNKKTSKWTIARLIMSGALVGIAVAGLLGVDTSALTNAVSGLSGAAVAAVALKLVHMI